VHGSGGCRSTSERELIAEAEKYAAQGCKYYKMKIHHPDPRENAKRVGAVRPRAGRRRAHDGGRQPAPGRPRNIRQAQALADFDLVWYEEPVLADDIAACRRSRACESGSGCKPAETTTRATNSASWVEAPRGALLDARRSVPSARTGSFTRPAE